MVGVCNVQTGLLLTRTYRSHTILFDPLENSKPLILYILYIYDIYYLTFAILKKKIILFNLWIWILLLRKAHTFKNITASAAANILQ